MFVSTKPTSPHEDHTRTDKIRNSCAHFLCVSCWDIRCHACNTKKHVLRDTSCRNPELNRVPKINLSYLQNISIFCPSGKCKLLIHSFLRYHNTIHFMHNIVPLKRYLVHDTKVHKIFLALALTITLIKSFTCNNTAFILFQLNIISPLNSFFQTHHHWDLKLDRLLTDWLSKYS